MSENRDEDTGQFTPSTEGLYGREAELVEAGYKQMPLANPVKSDPDDFSVSEGEAANIYSDVMGEQSPIIPIEYIDVGDGSQREPNEVVSLEQAAHDLAAWREDQGDSRAASISADFAAEVDGARAELDPKLAEHYGLEKTNDAAKPADLSEEPAAKPPSVDGLDPDVEKALAHPQIRQAIEQEVAETYKVREAYSTNLQQGQQLLQATVASLAPQLQNLPLEHWPQALANLHQTDPVRAGLVSDALTKWGTLQQAQQQDQQRQAYAAQQNFDNYAKAEDARFRTMVDHSPENMQKIGTEMVSYFSELGISQDELVHQLKNNPLMRSAAGQKVVYDAVQARLQQKAYTAARKSIPSDIPTVQRPGTAGPRPSFDTDTESKFNRSPSLKNAADFLMANRARRSK